MFFELESAFAALPELSDRMRAILACLLPGPVTVLLANPAHRFPLACGIEPDKLGIRVPALEGELEPLTTVRWPVLQSSANRAGEADVRRAEDVDAGAPRGRRPDPRCRGAAGHSVDGRRPLRVGGGRHDGARSRGCAAAGRGASVPPMSDLSPDYFLKPVAEVDPEIAEVLKDEAARQERTLEMIASENFVPQSVLDCQGSVLTNKYAEGYPGRRYYGGCEFVDIAEQLAIDRAKAIFGADHVNVQPHSGAQANSAVYMALLDPGDRILGMKLDHGGHLSHGMKINFSGRYFDIVAYGVREEDQRLDMDELAQIAEDAKPKLIIAGWSAYSRQLDFQRFREIADSVGALLMADIAHFAGLVAAEEHPSPVPYCDVVTTTTHKTLGGGRGGMIMCREEYAKKINSAVFPGHQGGPLMHTIAGKAVTFKIAQSDLFRERQRRTREGAAIVAEEMVAAGVNVLTGGTDVHLVLADLRDSELDGQQAEDRLHEIGITVNRNAVPFDPRPPAVSSGLRIGTPALATRGFQADDFREVGTRDRRGAHRRVLGLAQGRPLRAHARTGRQAPALSAVGRARGRLRPFSTSRASGWHATAGRCCRMCRCRSRPARPLCSGRRGRASRRSSGS